MFSFSSVLIIVVCVCVCVCVLLLLLLLLLLLFVCLFVVFFLNVMSQSEGIAPSGMNKAIELN